MVSLLLEADIIIVTGTSRDWNLVHVLKNSLGALGGGPDQPAPHLVQFYCKLFRIQTRAPVSGMRSNLMGNRSLRLGFAPLVARFGIAWLLASTTLRNNIQMNLGVYVRSTSTARAGVHQCRTSEHGQPGYSLFRCKKPRGRHTTRHNLVCKSVELCSGDYVLYCLSCLVCILR